jgi:polar amino acid transport system ATP-binding protein
MSALFEIKNLRKSFGENLVLDDVSINFPAQSATVIIGASGSGKSTLMISQPTEQISIQSEVR